MQHYMIKLGRNDRSMVFFRYFGVLHNKPDHLDITKISLNVALNTISLTLYFVLNNFKLSI